MSQSLSDVLIRLVFSTENREPRLTQAVCEELYPYIVATLKGYNCTCLQIGGVEDHVHILLSLSRKFAIAHVVEKVKVSSSIWMKRVTHPGFRGNRATESSRWRPAMPRAS